MYRNQTSRRKRRQRIIDENVEAMSGDLNALSLAEGLDENIALFQKLFTDVDTMQVRRFENENDASLKFAILFSDGVVDREMIGEHILRPLMTAGKVAQSGDIIGSLVDQVLKMGEAEKTGNVKTIVEAICYGDTALLMDGEAQAVVMNTKCFETRAVAEPESERSLTGPREGFTESLMTNLSLLRRKVRTNDLKMKMQVFGRRTQTKACVCYMEGLVNKSILAELQRRLNSVDIDGILDTNYLTELIRDNRMSIF